MPTRANSDTRAVGETIATSTFNAYSPGSSDTAPRAMRIERQHQPPLTLVLYRDREYLFGRGGECTVTCVDESVSRTHGRLSNDGQHWHFRDLGSRNGSFIQRGGDTQPFDDLRQLHSLELQAGDAVILGTERCRLVLLGEVPHDAFAEDIAMTSVASKTLVRDVDRAARHRQPVFLLGASGTGKTHVARRIHQASGSTGQFVLVNCGRLPRDNVALQSELLGHVKGGFTGASGARLGKLFAADGGTLFLDEVESLPPEAQDFLIDVLEGTGNFAPLGASGADSRPAPHFRLISASKQGLHSSGLRRDLIERLLGALIQLPRLEARRDDIPAMVSGFLTEHRTAHARDACFTPEAMALLKAASWPGQVRDLRRAVQLMVAEAHADRDADGLERAQALIGAPAVRDYFAKRSLALGETPSARTPAAALPKTTLTPEVIEVALKQTGGNKTRAAKLLGVALNTLKAKLKHRNPTDTLETGQT